MTPSATDVLTIDRAEAAALAARRSDARATRDQLHFAADVAHRAAIAARLDAERQRLAGFTRTRHRP